MVIISFNTKQSIDTNMLIRNSKLLTWKNAFEMLSAQGQLFVDAFYQNKTKHPSAWMHCSSCYYVKQMHLLMIHIALTVRSIPLQWCQVSVMVFEITSPTTWLLVEQLDQPTKENIQAPYHYPLCEGNLQNTGGFSSQRASNPHHDFIMCKSDPDSVSSPMLLFIIYIASVVRSFQCVVMRLYDWMALSLMEWKSAQGHENEICLPQYMETATK